MANGLARIARERTISTLARNLYDLSDADTETRRKAEEALLRANPGLARSGGFVAGRAVVVPNIPSLKMTDRVEVQKADLESLLGETARRLQEGINLVEEGAANARSNAESGLARLSDNRVQALVKKQNPQVAELLKVTGDGLTKKIENDAERVGELKIAFTDAQDKIAELARRTRKAVKGF